MGGWWSEVRIWDETVGVNDWSTRGGRIGGRWGNEGKVQITLRESFPHSYPYPLSASEIPSILPSILNLLKYQTCFTMLTFSHHYPQPSLTWFTLTWFTLTTHNPALPSSHLIPNKSLANLYLNLKPTPLSQSDSAWSLRSPPDPCPIPILKVSWFFWYRSWFGFCNISGEMMFYDRNVGVEVYARCCERKEPATEHLYITSST